MRREESGETARPVELPPSLFSRQNITWPAFGQTKMARVQTFCYVLSALSTPQKTSLLLLQNQVQAQGLALAHPAQGASDRRLRLQQDQRSVLVEPAHVHVLEVGVAKSSRFSMSDRSIDCTVVQKHVFMTDRPVF